MSAYTVKQVADILGYSTNSIYTFLKQKRIKGIRVGKGRFRIPQSELDRLLLTKDAKALTPQQYGLPVEAVPGVTQALPAGVIEAPRETVASPAYILSAHHVEVPSLFDWFIGIGSILLGLAMFLFSRVYEEFSFSQFLPLLPALRTTLIAGGFGMLLTDIVSRKTSIWHQIFHWTLVFAYALYTLILIRSADWEGTVIFGVLTAVLILTFFTGIGGIAGFAVFVVGVLAGLPLVSVFFPDQSSLISVVSYVPIPGVLLGYAWVAVVLGLACIVWLGYMRDRRVFWVGMMGESIILIALSIHFAADLAWGRSLFTLVTAMLSLFVPVWQSLTFTHKRDRAFVFNAFGSLLIVYICMIGVLRVMETNILQYASHELNNKASFGKSLTESTLLSARSALSSAASNPLLISSEQSGEKDEMTAFARALFEGSALFHRVVIVGRDGSLLGEYPLSTTGEVSYAHNDFFIAAEASRSVVTNTVYRGRSGAGQSASVVIAAPLVTSSKAFSGVIAGFLDLETLGNKLQQIASTGQGEYFAVVDSGGKYIIHPKTDTIGAAADTGDPVRLGLKGLTGVTEGYTTGGIRSLVAYDTINNDTGWAIDIISPVSGVLQATNAATLSVFSATVISIFIVAIFLLSHRTRVQIMDAAGPVSGTSHEERPGQTVPSSKKHVHIRPPKEDTS